MMDSDTEHLSIYDYLVFALMLLCSTLIGLYFHLTGGKQRTATEYLLGDSNMGIGPVAFSLMASFMSAITLLGVPAENYKHGTQFLLINVSYILATPLCAYIFLPVFYANKSNSSYEVCILYSI